MSWAQSKHSFSLRLFSESSFNLRPNLPHYDDYINYDEYLIKLSRPFTEIVLAAVHMANA